MVKAKEILFKVGKYLSLALAALYAIYAVIGIVSGIIGAASNTEEGLAVLIAAIITAVFTLIWAVIALFNSKYSSQAIETEDKKLYIINIVLGIISGAVVNAVGGVFGLILLNKGEENNSSEE